MHLVGGSIKDLGRAVVKRRPMAAQGPRIAPSARDLALGESCHDQGIERPVVTSTRPPPWL